MSKITISYAITPDKRFRAMVERSKRSLLTHNPGMLVRVKEVATPSGMRPIAVKAAAFAGIETPWVLFLDADTIVHGSLQPLLNLTPGQVSARPSNINRKALAYRFSRARWEQLCREYKVAPLPILHGGIILMEAGEAQLLSEQWNELTRAMPLKQLNKGAYSRPYDMYGLTLFVAQRGLAINWWGKSEVSFQWRGETGGRIHHYSVKRYPKSFA